MKSNHENVLHLLGLDGALAIQFLVFQRAVVQTQAFLVFHHAAAHLAAHIAGLDDSRWPAFSE